MHPGNLGFDIEINNGGQEIYHKTDTEEAYDTLLCLPPAMFYFNL